MAGRQRGGGPPPQQPPPHPSLTIEPHRHLHRSPPSSSRFSDRIAAHHREIQSLHLDNQRLASNHVALKQDLAISDEEVRQLLTAARKIREERESEVKEVYERSLKLESEVRGIEAMNGELGQVRADVQMLTESKIEMSAKLKGIEAELVRVRGGVGEVMVVRADIEAMRQELQKGRAAIEFEKKTQAANLEHRRTMERNMMTMQSEIERLRAELADAEKRARAAAAAAANPNFGYMGNYGSPNMAFGGGPYPPVQYLMHQVQNSAQGTPPAPYGPTGDSHGHVP